MRSLHVRPAHRPRRGVSDVVATVLLLAMTITMFASVFLFTNLDQGGGSQPTNQFSSLLAYTSSSSSQVASVTITHLSGTALSGGSTAQVAIYVVSQNRPSAIPTPSTIGTGRAGSSTWSFGQTWTLSLTSYGITTPDNLTITIVAGGVFEYRSTLVAVAPVAAPYLTLVSTSAFPVIHAKSFTLSAYATFASSSGNSVTVDETQIGGPSSVPMLGGGGSGSYSVLVTAPASTGTFELFLTATGSNGLHTVFVETLAVT